MSVAAPVPPTPQQQVKAHLHIQQTEETPRMRSKSNQRLIFWQGQTANWERSGLSQAAYCRENKLSNGSFSEWRSKLSARSLSNSVSTSTAEARFLELSPTPTTLRIECGKFIIEVAPGFDANHLRRVVSPDEITRWSWRVVIRCMFHGI